jgi:hypothetical protein
VDTFYCWVKLRLPTELFANLVADCPHLLSLVFSELASENVDNLEVATKAICELLFLSRTITEFQSIKEYIASNVDKLLASASVAI